MTLHSIPSVFLFLFCSITVSNVYAQQIKAETFNFTELAQIQATQSFKIEGEHEIDGGWRYLKGNLPFPYNAKIIKQKIESIPVPNTVELPSPLPLQSFLGHIDPINFIPPDCMGAVGLNEVVTATNEFVIVHSKNGGAVLSKVTFPAFFNNPGMSDPYIQFDPYINRYWLSGISTSTTNKVFIAVSQTSDPAGNWYRYSFTPASTDGALLLDHPYLGFDNKLLVVTGRKFPNGVNFTGPILFCFNKDSLAAGKPISFGTNAQTIEKTTADGDVPCPVTAMGLTSPASTFYIVQNWNGGASAIRLSSITGTLPNLTWNTSSAVFPSGGSSWADADLGNLAPQEEETRKVAVNDARISSAQMVNGKIWCAHHIGLPATGFNHTAVQWWQLTTTGTVLQRGRIDDPAGLISRYYPTIAVNPAENVIIGYSISSPTTRINAAYSTRTSSTPLNTTDDEYIYKGGISTYWKDYGSGRARWGDYSHSAVDPVTGDLWTIQQYADQRLSAADNDSRYGVWWAEVSFLTFNSDVTVSAISQPNGTLPYCTLPINPLVTIKNVGMDTLKTVKLGLILDGVNVGIDTLTGLSISLYGSTDVAIPLPLNPPPGNHILQVYTFEPDGVTDQRTANDTSVVSFSVLPTLSLPDVEGFESATFPPADGWSLNNPDGGLTWERTTVASKSGVASMRLNAFNYQTTKAVDILQSPKIDIVNTDSIRINFDVAYAQYDATSIDSLQIVYSTDCGATWLPTSYHKSGSALSTNGGVFVKSSFVPTASQWRNESVSISTCKIGTPFILIGIKAVNDFGNNIYVDNFSISKLDTKQENVALLSVNKPFTTLCTPDFVPEITIANFGFDTLKTLTINYQIDNGSISTFNYTGSLAKCNSQVVTLNAITSSTGEHVLTIFSTNPNGIADQYPGNDTVRKIVKISPILEAPVTEGFETTTFPPVNWSTQNPDGGLTWVRTTSAAKTGLGSMVIRNFDAPTSNTEDKFYSPVIKFDPKVDSFFVSFDYAYSQGATYPGSTNMPMDTLELQITQDCGQTFTTIWKKWGADLQTIGDPNLPSATSFFPGPTQWKNINIYLSPVIGNKNFQVYFTAKSNAQNNLYIDNINIYSKILPQRLKDQGYLLYPSPFRNSFIIRNYTVPTTLQSVAIYNSVGQMVWMKNYNGTGYTEMPVDLSNEAPGVYIVKLKYTDKTVIQRIVKQ
ncbi:T9SS type A sorting domain-containing protein [Ginsengibacter hankyongi]|uniref:T9SS type A sorting domain-containing protein n=1 Tax=Ginsengibacter hankyongi TaxID=2607284 RepID=A0A5J5IE09_9BACT|nr:choice-of-anchor J domain-containing protein [Ginsengibacter hankyongi]KAA9036617.1 T9SS type A sorting domain-containing protein [Ginsengibacter hankyongi]